VESFITGEIAKIDLRSESGTSVGVSKDANRGDVMTQEVSRLRGRKDSGISSIKSELKRIFEKSSDLGGGI